MSQITVRATTGRPLGSSSSRRLRHEGRLPGVVYGRGADPVAVTVDHSELRDALKVETGMNTVFQLEIDGTPEKVIIKEVQRDPIRRMASHVDFLRVADDEPIKVKVPIKLTGVAKEVAEAGALVEQKLFELPIVVLPTAIPLSIDADVSELTLDSRIAVRDLNLPEGSVTRRKPNTTVAAPVATRASRQGAMGEAAAGAESAEAAAPSED